MTTLLNSWCSNSSVSGIPYCPVQYISASKQSQWPSIIWTSTAFTLSNCTSSSAYYAWRLEGSAWRSDWFCATTTVDTYSIPGYTYFGSVRSGSGFRIVYRKCSILSVPAHQRKQAGSVAYELVDFYGLYSW